MPELTHGAYGEEVPDGIYQIKYAGGGHPGCGGYIEALCLEAMKGPIYILHEHAHDCDGRRWRWREFTDECELRDGFDKLWCSRNRDGFSPWFSKPFWEIVNYNDSPYMNP